MPEFCNCGAQLPPDALFCHKCGKPQREIVEPEPPPPAVVQLPPPSAAQQTVERERPVDFHNPVAVRIALLVAVAASVLGVIPLLNWLAGGFFAAFVYRRKTGRFLNVSGGVRMGWITGLLMYGITAMVVTAQMLPAALSGKLAGMLQEQMKTLPGQDPAVQQMVAQQITQFLQTPVGAALMMIFLLGGLFVFITGLSMAGGALGAKMVGGREA